MLGVLVALAFTIATRSAWVVVAVACLLVYGAQVYYLGSIGKFAPQQRLQIWLLSFLGHFLLFGVVLWGIGELSVALAVLLPEVVSGAMHLVGIHHAVRALRAT
jgi:ATP/ADP translocase